MLKPRRKLSPPERLVLTIWANMLEKTSAFLGWIDDVLTRWVNEDLISPRVLHVQEENQR